jgi:prepilin-type N-terminal cleavage/methylation domain-containing protein
MNRNKSGFTLVELLVVVAIIALLIGLLLPALGRAQRAAKTLNDANNISQIHKGFLTWANADPKGYLPLPGLIRRAAVPGAGPGGAAAFVPGQGEEQQNQNNSANLYSAMIAKNNITPEILVSPVETNPVVRQITNYNFQSYNPAGTGDAFGPFHWDANFRANIHLANDGSANGVCHTSYAHLALIGDRKKLYWSNKASSSRPVLGNRGTFNGAISGDNYRLSYTLLFHDPDNTWEGNICYGDNHVNLEKSVIPDTVQFECGSINLKKDNIFTFSDFASGGCKGIQEGDTWMCIGIGNPTNTVYVAAPEKLTTGANPT